MRFLAVAGVLFLFNLHGTVSSDIAAVEPSGNELMRWLVTQGGLTIALLTVLWFYRRDAQQMIVSARAENSQLITTLQATSAALTTHADALRQLTSTVHEETKQTAIMTQVVERCRAVQTILERQGEE